MANKLMKAFRDKASKSKDYGMFNEGECSVAYSTGFLGLDFLNGTVIHVKSDKHNFTYNSVGIVDGCATTAIGRPGSGKTTLLIQVAANIVRPFKTAAIYYDDIEGGSTDRRREILTRMSAEELSERMSYRNTGITVENFYERIRLIHDIKTSNRADYEYDTGLYDSQGNRIYKLEPTVYILDSIPMLMPKDIMDQEELSGQMSVSSIAKTNTFTFKKISQLLKEANIILLCINHILDDICINPMQRKKAQLSYLKQGERLSGGRAAIYLANNMFRVDDNSKLKPEDSFGISGSIVDIQILKSRTNKSGKTIPLVFNQETGFDPDLSLFVLLKANNKVKGAGSYLYFGERNDIKFSQKEFKNKLRDNVELQKIFAEECYEVLSSLLSDTADDVEIDEEATNTSDLILGMGMSSIDKDTKKK